MNTRNGATLKLDQPRLPDFVGSGEFWIGKIVLIGAGIWGIWKGVKYTFQQLRKAWLVVVQFAGALDALEQLAADTAVVKARQRAMIETNVQAMWRADPQGRCVDANAAYLRMVGLPLSEVVGSGWESAIHPDDLPHVIAAWDQSIRDSAQFNRTFRMRTSDGYTLKVTTRAFPVSDIKNNVVEFQGVTTVLSRKPATADGGN